MYRIRPVEDRDFERMAAIRNATFPEPVSGGQVGEWYRRDLATSQPFHYFVAEAADGSVTGYASVQHNEWHQPDEVMVRLNVHPDYRRQGVGRLLHAEVERLAKAHGFAGMEAYCQGDDDESYAWAQRRGFVCDRQRTESFLDLTTWDGSRFAGHIETVAAGGIRLSGLSGQPDEALLRQLYRIDKETSPDIPICDGPFPTYENWRVEYADTSVPRFFAVARDGDNAIGFSVLGLPTVPCGGAYTGFTGVLREYRGRGVALGLKLLTVEAALKAGAPRMRTNNDPDNPPMLAVNEKMGYQMVPGPRRLKRRL